MNRSLRKAYEITNAKISFVSLVDKAANKRTFLMKKAQDGKATFTTYGRIIKAEAETHYVTGIVYEPMEEDTHGNYMTEDEIVKAAHWFMKNGNMVDLQHSFEPLDGASVVESWVAKADFDIDGETIRKGTWLMTVEVSDDAVWDGIEKGEITGFSMGGIGDYSEEDVDLETVSKNAGDNTGNKKGLLKQLADALGFGIVEKGAVAELYDKRTKGTRFWDAVSSLETTLRHYDPVTDTYIYETDDAKVRECLEDFNSIVTSILSSSEPIAKAIQTDRPVEKAGKAMSSKNLETLHGIKESLDAFIKAFEPEPDDDPDDDDPDDKQKKGTGTGSNTGEGSGSAASTGDTGSGEQDDPDDDPEDKKGKSVKKEDINMTNQEFEAAIASAIAKAMGTTQPQDGAQKTVEKAVTPEGIQAMVEQAVAKALEPVQKQEQEPEQVTAEGLADMIQKAVDNAVAPILKAKGLPTNLNGSDTVEKNAGGEHYLHGIL